jgi:putative glutamine amidotransferase
MTNVPEERSDSWHGEKRTRLRVALTTTIEAEAGMHARPAVFLYTSYIRALERFGLIPVLITPAHSPDAIDALLDACCGLVLTGGEDVEPKRYGEAPSPALGAVQPARDEAEFRVLDCAVRRRMPVFGICRGLQVMNVHFGGTLYQDIATDRAGENLTHEQTGAWGERAHNAEIVPTRCSAPLSGRSGCTSTRFTTRQ